MEQFVEQLFQDPLFQRPESILTAAASLVAAALLALPISWVYMRTAKKENYKQSLVQAFIFLSVIVAAAMLVIGNNLARAFGLVGAVSIIRFRSRVNNPKDIAYIFVSITIGMASGLGLYSVAFLTSSMMTLLSLFFRKYNLGAARKRHEYVVTMKADSILSAEQLFARHLLPALDRWKLEKVHADGGKQLKLEYRMWLSEQSSIDRLMRIFQHAWDDHVPGVEFVKLDSDSNNEKGIA